MDHATLWFLIIGTVLIIMTVAASFLRPLPISASIFYLATGFFLGPHGIHLLDLDFQRDAKVLERVTEIAVIISLFTAGLKLRAPLKSRVWLPAMRLATAGMVLTVAMVAIFGVHVLGLSLGAAVLLGAVMAPTDPVLASDVQTRHPYDRDRLRFSLTTEAGLNDGTAFPFVMLGLGLLGLHELGDGGWQWFTVDLVWATVAGLGTGTLLGTVVARFILYLRQHHREAVGLDDFLALGLVALSYGVALAIHSYGFLAVFAAGLALRHVEQESTSAKSTNDHIRDEAEEKPASNIMSAPAPYQGRSGEDVGVDDEFDAATDPEKAPVYMARAVLQFNESLERIAEVALVITIGCLLDLSMLSWQGFSFVLVLLLIIRPVAASLSLWRAGVSKDRLKLISWFGIRGIGSLYYLAYALTHEVGTAEGRLLSDLALTAVTVSVIIHGTTVTPLMRHYTRGRGSKEV